MLECATSFATSFAQSKNWIGNKYEALLTLTLRGGQLEICASAIYICGCGASGEWKYDIQMVKCKRSNIVIQLFKYFESKQHWQWPVGTDPGIEKRSFIESAHLSIPIWRQCWTPTPRWAILWTIWNLSGHLSSDLDILVWTRNLAAWWQEVFDLLLPLWRCFKWYCGTKVWQSWLGQDFKL